MTLNKIGDFTMKRSERNKLIYKFQPETEKLAFTLKEWGNYVRYRTTVRDNVVIAEIEVDGNWASYKLANV
jgi:hypothetical protein